LTRFFPFYYVWFFKRYLTCVPNLAFITAGLFIWLLVWLLALLFPCSGFHKFSQTLLPGAGKIGEQYG
jgi:hypothetical protein